MILIADQYERLDKFLARSLPDFSRTRLVKVIEAGLVLVDGDAEKPAFKLEPGMEVELEPPAESSAHDLEPFPLALDVRYEDEDLLVVNKPRGLATHPASTLKEPSLVNALLAHGTDLSSGVASFRPGIVHRLDKETTGLLLVAKNDAAHASLSEQIAEKTAGRTYLAIVAGKVEQPKFNIDAPLGRDPKNRLRMTVTAYGRSSLTYVERIKEVNAGSVLKVDLATGRTHQIRVHLLAVGHPIVGDAVYAPKSYAEGAMQLHAARLRFKHPRTGAEVVVTAEPPSDFLAEFTAEEWSRLFPA